MTDAPVIFKRTKSKPAQRGRTSTADIAESGADGEAADVEVEESPSTLATKLKKKIKTREKPKSKLSFGGDEVRRHTALADNH